MKFIHSYTILTESTKSTINSMKLSTTITSNFTIIFLVLFSLYVGTDSVSGQLPQEVEPDCILRGESAPPPPFIVLRWTMSGECNSTIDYFLQFYDIKSALNNGDEFILFLET